MGKIVVDFTHFLVLVAGLEPARTLVRGILRHMRVEICTLQKYKIRAFLAENRLKMLQNQTYPFVTKSLKSATSQNFPNFSTKMSHIYWLILRIIDIKYPSQLLKIYNELFFTEFKFIKTRTVSFKSFYSRAFKTSIKN